jgi:hypothetical protein
MSEPKIQDAEIVPESQALAIRQPQEVAPVGLFGTVEPVAVIEKASAVATALKGVIARQGLISKISGKEYPRCEAWTLLGTMLGVFPVLCWSRAVEGGWEARVEAKTRSGDVVGAAEAQCLRGERNWKDRDDFALRSMAQTRATAKCLRMPLGFVMTLAGYEATPAEEMGYQPTHEAPRPAPRAAAPPASAPPPAAKPAAPALSPTVAPAPAAPKAATASYRAKMIENLKAGVGQPNRPIVTEYFEKIDQLIPGESLESLELRFVPSTAEQMNALADKLAGFGNGEQAARAFVPGEIGAAPASAPAPVATPKQPKDDEWWREIVVVVPRKGQKRDEYLRNPDTIGSLFEARHDDEDARKRLFGFVSNYEAKPWTGNDGKVRPPNKADVEFRTALDAFKDWYDHYHAGEKL